MMEKSTDFISQCCIVDIFREAQIILWKEKCASGHEQPTLITTVFTHEIYIENPACFGANVSDMIFQSLERLQVLRLPRLSPSPFCFPMPSLRLCNVRVMPSDLGPSPHSFRF